MMLRSSIAQRALLLVGTDWRRKFLISSALHAAREAGLDIVLLDSAVRRGNSIQLVPDDRFIPGDIDATTQTDLAALTEQMAIFAEASEIHFEGVFTGLDAYIEIAAMLADRLGTRGHSAVAADNAQNKNRTRSLLAADAQLSTPFGIAESLSDARLLFSELGPPVVLKPVRGAGSRGVRTDIRSPEQAALAWQSVRRELQNMNVGEVSANGSARGTIMMERQLSGTEVDVELVLQDSDCRFAAVADNPAVSLPIGIETGTSYPSQLPESEQNALIASAQRALARLGLRNGNFHVEMVLTEEGPKVIEVNARMGGAFVWEAMQAVYGVDLVKLGVDAVLGRPLPRSEASPRCALEARFFIARVSGELIRVDGLELLAQCPGYAAIGLWKQEGDRVLAPEVTASDYLGFAAFSGTSADEARERATVAFRQVSFWIRTIEGEIVRSQASFMHELI